MHEGSDVFLVNYQTNSSPPQLSSPNQEVNEAISLSPSPSLQREQEEQEEKRRYENQYEETRRLALERIKQEEQRRKEEEHTRAAELRQQMEELKSREAEVKTPPLLYSTVIMFRVFILEVYI